MEENSKLIINPQGFGGRKTQFAKNASKKKSVITTYTVVRNNYKLCSKKMWSSVLPF